MQAKGKHIPLPISNWMEKDVRVSKLAPNLGIMRNDTRQTVMLNRQFFSDMFVLSSERSRKLAEHDFQRKRFLKNQRTKAETILPGLLPYIEDLTKDMDSDLKSRNIQNTSHQSFTSPFLSRSNTKFETTLKPSPEPKKQFHMPKIPSVKGSARREKTFDTITRLARPKTRNTSPIVQKHVRPNMATALTVEDMFGSIDEMSNYSFSIPDKPKTPKTDRRFQRLIHLFSDVYEREPSNFNSVRSIVDSNPSLQGEEKSWERVHTPNIDLIQTENHQVPLDDDYYSKTETYSTDFMTNIYED